VIYEAATKEPPFKAKDMQGLYKVVCRGSYPPIPNVYSADLSSLIASMLQVQPSLRPNCDRLLEMPVVRKHMQAAPRAEIQSAGNLMQTIKLPRNFNMLHAELPGPQYERKSRRDRSCPASTKQSLERPSFAREYPEPYRSGKENSLPPSSYRGPQLSNRSVHSNPAYRRELIGKMYIQPQKQLPPQP
jgi:hypothetical protein